MNLALIYVLVFIQVEELLQSQTKETEKENVLIEELREQQQALTEYAHPLTYPYTVRHVCDFVCSCCCVS